jgi:peptidoglycan hydrolase-like protein with peptidoglycan-binding domain
VEHHRLRSASPGDAAPPARRRAPVVGALLPAALALLLASACESGVPDLEPGRAPSTTTSADDDPTSTPSARTSTSTPTEDPAEEPAPEPTDGPTGPPTPSPSPTAPTPTPPPAAEPTPPPEPEQLARGASGDRVTALQARLAELGYFIGPPDGSFGPGTQQGVWALQKAAGTARDGVVGPATQAALDAGVRPQARSGSGRVIEIDLDRQLLLAVEDGRVVTVVNASSGNGERFEAKGRTYRAGTPRGTFQVGRQVDANYESSLELGSMWRPKFFTGGIAVHGSGSIPPWPASHGCVRVSNGAMNWIWDAWGAPPGTTVLVY